MIYSLMLTCRACGHSDLAAARAHGVPQRDDDADIGDLLPINFSKTSAA
ncbi:transposase family protein [Brucella intermedia LMG 3301]|uniref:Transposase family protein n=1 Tax=Brucella intermedia LMG 3301 TaxID=641118 RepID=C4WR03_9HYPH|nr:transposase family protein [Brucella intermedia LMG 3301]